MVAPTPGSCHDAAMLSLGTTVVTVEDLPRAAAFWRDALGYVDRRPASDDWLILDPPDGQPGGSLALSVRYAPHSYPPRIHLDLYATDQQTEIERLIGLGARRIDWDGYPPGADYVVLEDTEGNRFCVVDAPDWDPVARRDRS
jgi:predicted enzyme related to lactoylglutathione lyase